MKLLFFLLIAWNAWAIDVPIRSDGGSISYATEGLLSMRGNLKPPPYLFDVEELNSVLFSELKEQNADLKKVKFYLINGEIRLAKVHLGKLTYLNTKLKPIIYRYLAILNFMTSDFDKVNEYLMLPELQNLPHYAKVCTLKVLSEIVLDKLNDLEDDWTRCQVENPGNFREKNLIWLDTLVQLKLNPKRGVTKIPFKRLKIASLDNDELKVMLKLALYLNQEKLVVEQLPELAVEQLQDTEIRELAGQIFFRMGYLARSYRFVEDLKSPNSENIKGNLYLLRNKFELAYAQFKLALEQKQNSQNAMERLLPLAWLLGDWEGGTKYSEMVIASPQTKINKMTLNAAFLMQKGDYEQADRVLAGIAEKSRRGTEIEVTQLASFTALMQNKPDMVRKQANMSCEQYDLVNCWLLFQLGQWDAFPLTIRRDEKLTEKRDWEKLVKEEFNQPLKETVYVNQIDIEEMDDKLIQLIPKQ